MKCPMCGHDMYVCDVIETTTTYVCRNCGHNEFISDDAV